MKKICAISLATNVLLLAALIASTAIRRPASPPAPPAAVPVARSAATPPAPGNGPPIRLGGDWHNWIEPLRAAQVPVDVLAGLVQADFDRRWQVRQAELQAKYLRGEIGSDQLALADLEREAALDREWQAALGPEGYRAWDMPRVLQGFASERAQLSAPERAAVYDLERGLRADLHQMQEDKLRGRIDQATFDAKQQGAQDEVTQKLRALLGAPRASQLQGADDTPGTLQRALRDLPVTAPQFAALADVQQHWDRTRSALVTEQVGTQNPALSDRIAAAETQWRQDFERIAGAAALERYLQAQDSRYADLQRHAARWGVAPDAVDPIFARLKNFEETVRAYRLDAQARAVAPAASETTLRQFGRDAERQLKTEVGAPAYDHLTANGITFSAAAGP